MRCQACGTENSEGAVYCSHCARKLDAETQQRVIQQREEHTATGIRWTAVILAVIVVVVVLLVAVLVVGAAAGHAVLYGDMPSLV